VDGCEILHQWIDGLSWFIPLFIGYQHVSSIQGGAGFFFPSTALLAETSETNATKSQLAGLMPRKLECYARPAPRHCRGFCPSHLAAQSNGWANPLPPTQPVLGIASPSAMPGVP